MINIFGLYNNIEQSITNRLDYILLKIIFNKLFKKTKVTLFLAHYRNGI